MDELEPQCDHRYNPCCGQCVRTRCGFCSGSGEYGEGVCPACNGSGRPTVAKTDPAHILAQHFEPKHDSVNHPKHYTSHPSGVECITVVRHMNFNLGNVIKYIWRAGHKDEAPTIQDLEKAAWYLKDEIERRKKEDNV